MKLDAGKHDMMWVSIPAICWLTKLAVAMSADRKEHHSAEYSFLSCSGSSTYNPWSKKMICGAAHPNFSQRHLHAARPSLMLSDSP